MLNQGFTKNQMETMLQATLPAPPNASLPPALPLPEPLLAESMEAQNQLTILLSQVYAAQATYGDKAQMMEMKDQIFQMVLGRFPFSRIKAAFLKFLETERDLPTPSDIVKIMEPPPEKLSESMYINLKKKASEGWIGDSERQFINEFERRQFDKVTINTKI